MSHPGTSLYFYLEVMLISIYLVKLINIADNTNTQTHCTKWKKPDTKGHILYDSFHMKYPGKANS